VVEIKASVAPDTLMQQKADIQPQRVTVAGRIHTDAWQLQFQKIARIIT